VDLRPAPERGAELPHAVAERRRRPRSLNFFLQSVAEFDCDLQAV